MIDTPIDQKALEAACKAYAQKWMPSDAPEFVAQAMPHVTLVLRPYLDALSRRVPASGELEPPAVTDAMVEAAKAVEDDMRWMAADRHRDIQPLVRERLIEGADMIERFRAALASLPMPVAGTAEGSLAALRDANIRRQAIWCPDEVPDLSFRGNELSGETGEACNVIKKLERERHGWRGSRDTVAHLAEELADVVICADLCAITAGINLAAAVVAKFNATSEKVGIDVKLAATAPAPEGKAEPAAYMQNGIPHSPIRYPKSWRDEPEKHGLTPLFASPPRAEAAVIERCAKVAEEFADKARYVGPDANLKIAAAIRALSTPPGAP